MFGMVAVFMEESVRVCWFDKDLGEYFLMSGGVWLEKTVVSRTLTWDGCMVALSLID